MVAEQIPGYFFVRAVGPGTALDSTKTRGKEYTHDEVISFETERLGIPEADILLRHAILDKRYINIYRRLPEQTA